MPEQFQRGGRPAEVGFAEPAARWIETSLKALAPAEDANRGRVIAVDFGAKAPAAGLAAYLQKVNARIPLLNAELAKIPAGLAAIERRKTALAAASEPKPTAPPT